MSRRLRFFQRFSQVFSAFVTIFIINDFFKEQGSFNFVIQTRFSYVSITPVEVVVTMLVCVGLQEKQFL